MLARSSAGRGQHPIAQVRQGVVGLGHHVGGAGAESAGDGVEAPSRGHHDDRRERRVLLREPQELDAPQWPRGVEIHEHHGKEACGDLVAGPLGVAQGGDAEPGLGQHSLETVQDGLVAVHDQDVFGRPLLVLFCPKLCHSLPAANA